MISGLCQKVLFNLKNDIHLVRGGYHLNVDGQMNAYISDASFK